MPSCRFSSILFSFLAFFAAASVEAKTCKLAISGNDSMQYSVKELTVDADCTDVELTLTHSGKLAKNIMGHNWILVKDEDFTAVGADALKAGPAKDYMLTGDKRMIASTKTIGGGEKATAKFKKSDLKAGGNYTFFCSFPGHSALMKGKLVVK